MSQVNKYRDIWDQFDECILVIDYDSRILYANQPLCQLAGKDVNQLTGNLLASLFPAEWFGFEEQFLEQIALLSSVTGEDVCTQSRWFEWRARKYTAAMEKSILLVGRDITTRKRKELELAEEGELYRQFVENQPVGMFRSTVEKGGEFVMANSAAAELLGYSSVEALLGVKALDLYKERGDRRKLLDRLLEEENIVGVEVESRKRDGATMVAGLTLQLVRRGEGTPLYIDATITDVTEKKKIEESLWLTQSIYDRAAVGIYRLDSSGKILDANDMAARMLGYSNEALLKMNIWDVDPDITPEDWKVIWDAAVLEKHSVFERLHRRKDGTVMPVEISSNIMEYGGIQYSISFATDITERKQTEKALQTSERLHKQAQQIARLGHWEKEYGNDDVVWSEEVYRIHELDKEGIRQPGELYQAAFDRIAKEDQPRVSNAVTNALKEKGEIDLTYKLVLPGDKLKWVNTKAHIEYGEDGTPIKTVGTIQDVTERKKAEIEKEEIEQKLLQSQKLDAIGKLAGGIAHDFNNILTSMIGFTQLAENQLPAESTVRRHLEQVVTAGLRARELVAHILTFSRQNEQAFEVVDLGRVVDEVEGLLRASLPANIEMTKEVCAGCGKVFGVPVQIHQVLVNLCTNAQYAIGSGKGTLSISLNEVDIVEEDLRDFNGIQPGRYARLRVTDTGCGMDQDTLAKVYDPYYSTRPKGEGTGLGLSVVHGIVKKHGGYIHAESEPGTGTSFSVYLPCLGEGVVVPVVDRERIVPTGVESLVIVDDEATITEMLTDMTGRLGYTTTVFNNPKHAEHFLLQNGAGVDLVITDLTMPEMDGVELAGSIRKMGLTVPIILQTGFSETVTGKILEEAGISLVIRKPVLEQELAQYIRQVLDRTIE